MSPRPASEPDLSRFVVVLARAEESGNVGAACRAMKVMGLSRLALAGDRGYDEDRVATMAVHAFDVYQGATRHADLAAALASTSFSAGFTRRRGERRKTFSQTVEGFMATALGRPAGGDIALVFGNERSGLSGEELSLCSVAVHIPSSEVFPSLNLAQAVQIAAWELRRQAEAGRWLPGPAPPNASVRRADVDASVERAAGRLAELGFFKLNQGEDLREFLRDLAERAALSSYELRYFESFIHKMAALANKSHAGKEGAGKETEPQ
ncbi:MAG: RNA methyltransferase [Spirochaetota bacterium]